MVPGCRVGLRVKTRSACVCAVFIIGICFVGGSARVLFSFDLSWGEDCLGVLGAKMGHVVAKVIHLIKGVVMVLLGWWRVGSA